MSYMGEALNSDEEASAYVRSRSRRYAGGMAIEPQWCEEALADEDLVAFEPDPKSRIGASRFIGWSRGARRALVVIAYRDLDGDLHLINAWPATGADLAFYVEGKDGRHGEDD